MSLAASPVTSGFTGSVATDRRRAEKKSGACKHAPLPTIRCTDRYFIMTILLTAEKFGASRR